jgi:large subunit ribosomal protein L27
MAHKKGAGSTRNGRDSNAQRRGIKVYGGREVTRGQHPRPPGRLDRSPPARTSAQGKDFTLFALIDGVVKYEWRTKDQKKVSVYPVTA